MDVRHRFDLGGKVALITGASSGLGAATASALATAGATVVLAARRTKRLERLRNELTSDGLRATAVTTDVTKAEDCMRLAGFIHKEYGQVDILVNNAGATNAAPALQEKEEDFRRVMDVNLMGAFLMAQSCAPLMPCGGSIVNVSSIAGMRPSHLPLASYASSKAALLGLTRELAAQWTLRLGVRVNAIAPGYVATELTRDVTEVDKHAGRLIEATPMRRFGEPEEIAAAVLFLASDASSFMTGAVIVMDGGLSV